MPEVFVDAETAITEIAAGRMIVVTDAEDRENEGDVVVAAEHATPEAVNFMARHARGLVCLALESDRCDALGLPPLPRRGDDPYGTAFTASIGARGRHGSGVSAHERARTIGVAVDPASSAADLVRPGHVFPLRARRGGVLERPGHTEASVDLARLAGTQPAGVICEVLNEDGTMSRVADLKRFCSEHGMVMVTIEELVAHRRRREPVIRRAASATLPTPRGVLEVVGYRDEATGAEHVALVAGEVAGGRAVPTVVHAECAPGDAFRSVRCDCGSELDDALRQITEIGRGVVVRLLPEGHAAGLVERLRAHADADDPGRDAVAGAIVGEHRVAARDLGVAMRILRDLGVRSAHPITDDPGEAAALAAAGVPLAAAVLDEHEPLAA